MHRFRGGKLTLILATLEQPHGVQFRDDFVAGYRAEVNRLFETELKPTEGIVEVLEAALATTAACVLYDPEGLYPHMPGATTIARMADLLPTLARQRS